ncbi:MAG: phosphatidylserine decarboxylase family protein [Nitrospirae bacterium]|nr:phosphatidylserine decarboxylase family protein [Nitrospirota bacterium]
MNAFAPEGSPFIIVFIFITLAALFVRLPWLTVLFLVLTLFMFYFFRDPERTVPQDKGVFVSPADGRVILIKEIHGDIIPPDPWSPSAPPEAGNPPLIKGDFIKISIFMSPFNVHVNRAPCDGVVKAVKHTPGRFFAADKDEASMLNENIAMVLEGGEGTILVRQVAGFIARRAVCRVKAGDKLKRGERYGIIKFSSRLDVYLPLNANIKVKLGDRVKAGETILGVIEDK